MEIPYGKEEREGEKRQFKTKQKKKKRQEILEKMGQM